MLKRTISGVILVIVAIISFTLGGYVLFGLTMFLSLLGMYELYRAMHAEKTSQAIIGYIGLVVYYITMLSPSNEQYFLPAFSVFLLVLMISYVFTFPKRKSTIMFMVPFGLVYVGVFLSYIYRTRVLPGGVYLVWVILLGAWGSDTFAYLVGCSIGKHKAFPRLSPKKTWEGCAGGVIGAFLIGSVYGLCCDKHLPDFSPVPTWLVIGIVCACSAVLSMFGDLTASAIKRDNGIKDYGKLIPGHGGVLDRFDSVLFTAPCVFYLIKMFLWYKG